MRLQALRALDVLDTPPEAAFDDIVLLARHICGTDVAMISLIDEQRQWFKARAGVEATETPRDVAFCAHTILQPDALTVVEDATRDARFSENPLVMGEPNIRFYAGAPIVTREGAALGTVCVVDFVARSLNPAQRQAMQALARQAGELLRLRERNREVEADARDLRQNVQEALADDHSVHAPLRARQRVAAVGQLASGIAHDFNNLLQGINGHLQLVQRQAGDAEQVRRWSGRAIDAVGRGGKLISRLLAHSREGEGESDICIAQCLGEIDEMLQRVLGSQLPVDYRIEDPTACVRCDPTHLEAALLNLAINARDAMQGKGPIHVSSRVVQVAGDAELADGRYVELCVRDEGPGMPPEVAARVFEPFFTTKEKGKGTGLGLAQVHGFALHAGGTARVTQADAGGTAITLWLRALETAPAA